jgi:hypothetical protein
MPPGYTNVVIDPVYGPPAIDSMGQVAFVSLLTGSAVPSLRGLWSEDSGALKLIAGPPLPAPGFPAGAVFGGRQLTGPPRDSRLFYPAYNAAGQVAFSAFVFAGAESRTRLGSGIFLEESGALIAAVREGDSAPGTAAGLSEIFVVDDRVGQNVGVQKSGRSVGQIERHRSPNLGMVRFRPQIAQEFFEVQIAHFIFRILEDLADYVGIQPANQWQHVNDARTGGLTCIGLSRRCFHNPLVAHTQCGASRDIHPLVWDEYVAVEMGANGCGHT